MSDVKWIKMSTEVFDNRKIRQIEAMPEGDSIIVIWFKLLCLAGCVNDKGYIYITQEVAYTEQTLAVQFNRPLTTVQLALKVLEEFGMIEVIDDILCISNWEKYQSIEKLEKMREQTRQRVAKYRKNQKKLECNVTCNADVTQCNATDIDIDIDIDKDIDIKEKNIKKKSTFVPPTVEEVANYCKERGNNVDAESFVAFYDSKNWMVGKNKMASWKSAIITWEKRDNSYNNTNNKNVDFGYINKPIINRDVDMEGLF